MTIHNIIGSKNLENYNIIIGTYAFEGNHRYQ